MVTQGEYAIPLKTNIQRYVGKVNLARYVLKLKRNITHFGEELSTLLIVWWVTFVKASFEAKLIKAKRTSSVA